MFGPIVFMFPGIVFFYVWTHCFHVSQDCHLTLTFQLLSQELQQSIQAHMTARLDAYKAKNMQPKAHYSLHLPKILARDGTLASCWAHERKHRALKRHGNNSTNANKKMSWEHGVIQEVVLSQYLELQEWDCRGGIELIDAKEASVDMTNGLKQTLGLAADPSVRVFVASEAQCNYESMSRGDAVCTSTHIVEIWFHVQVVSDIHDTSYHSIVSKWTPLQGHNLFQMTDVPELVPTGSLQRALPFCVSSGVATVIPWKCWLAVPCINFTWLHGHESYDFANIHTLHHA